MEGKKINFLILINLKTYDECIGSNALELANICYKLSIIYGIDIAIAPQYPDIYRLSSNVNLPIYSQHVDNIYQGNNTGRVSIKCIKEAGASGSILNHSEHSMKLRDIGELVDSLKKENLTSIVCSPSYKKTISLLNFNPDYIAIEPPELIGSGISIVDKNKKLIEQVIKYIEKNNNSYTKLLCGAGISTGHDIKLLYDIGVSGALVASAITKSTNKYSKLENLICKLK